jgi:hypothetical protein
MRIRYGGTGMIEIRIPRKEVNSEFIRTIDRLCGELNLQVHVTVIDVLQIPVMNITIEGKLTDVEDNHD